MSPEFLVTSLVVILVPGTGVVYTVATGLMQGRAPGVVAAAGCTLGILPHMAAAALGLAALMHTSTLAFEIVKYCGVGYLLFIAWQTWKDEGPLQLADHGRPNSGAGGILLTGFLINILNPKLSVFFLAFMPQFIDSASGRSVATQTILLGALFMAMTFAVFVVYGLFAGTARQAILTNRTALTWMRRAVSLAFAGFALRLAFSSSR